MTRADVVRLALRIAALYVAIHACFLLTPIAHILASGLDEHGISLATLRGFAVSAGLLATLAVGLFLAAPLVARRTPDGAAQASRIDAGAIGALALQLAGIWLWDRALGQIADVIFRAQAPAGAASWVGAATVAAAFLALGTTLFLGAPGLATRLFGRGAGEATIQALQAAAFSVVGLWILAQAFPDALAIVAGAFELARSEEVVRYAMSDDGLRWAVPVQVFSRVALGVALFLGGRHLSLLWHRLRSVGLEARDRSI